MENTTISILSLGAVSASKKSTSSSSSFEVQVQAMSGSIKGNFGEFTVIRVADKDYNVDSRKVSNRLFFPATKTATVQLVEAKNKAGQMATFIQAVAFHIPSGAISSQF